MISFIQRHWIIFLFMILVLLSIYTRYRISRKRRRVLEKFRKHEVSFGAFIRTMKYLSECGSEDQVSTAYDLITTFDSTHKRFLPADVYEYAMDKMWSVFRQRSSLVSKVQRIEQSLENHMRNKKTGGALDT